ncbi:LysR family transcriptional regulator [Caldimonas tepidiphila]|uniref:LysR family transcriptional regulator n=1 Tax=Caldimonas tepidiphila TaxID=2315841 RepID=UPI000E5B3A6B|nr:LysR family transcriptional regulator [Caldimonas tepidiphila]
MPTLADPPLAEARALPPLVERLRALRCLVAVERHGSAARAAEAIHLSQPAVTRAILELERLHDVRLFERAAKGMMPTVLGSRLARRADVLLLHLARGASEAFAAAPPLPGAPPAPGRFAAAVSAAALKALLAVAVAGSEARAAQALGVSQPSVHGALRELERQLGLTLFHKSARGTRLTFAGEALLRRVKLACAEARAMEGDIAAWRGEIRGRIVIGALPLSVSIFLPRAVDALRRRHPEVEILITDGTYESLMQKLLEADVDIILGALRTGAVSAEVRQEVLFEDELAVVARVGHPCLSAPSPDLGELLRWEWVVPLAGTPASVALHRAFASRGLPPPAGCLQANSPSLTRELVLQTDRLALSSRGQLGEAQGAGAGGLCIVPVALPGTVRPIGAVIRSLGEPSPDLQAFLAELRAAVPAGPA